MPSEDGAPSLDDVLAVLDQAGEAIIVSDEQTHVVWVNEGAQNLLGYKREEFEKLTSLAELAAEDERERVMGFARTRIEGGIAPKLYRTFALRADGERLPVEIAVQSHRWGARVRTIALVRDISDRVAAEEDASHQHEQLRRQSGELSALHDTALGLLERLDPNSLLETIVVRAAELMDTPNGYVYVVDGDGAHLSVRVGVGTFATDVGYRLRRGEGVAGHVWETGQTFTVDDYSEFAGRTPDFERLHAVVGVPLLEAGEIVGVIGLAHLDPARRFDRESVELLERFGRIASLALQNARLYAERHDAATKLLDAYETEHKAAERFRELDEMKNAFLGAVSHELRTPLTSVLGFSETLQLDLSDADRHIVTDRLVTSARRLSRLLEDLLDLDRLVRGVLEPLRRRVRVDEVVRRTIDEIEVTRPLSVTTQPFEAEIDPLMLERIIVNLIGNAQRYTPDGTGIEVSAHPEEGGVLVVVDDHGPGVPDELKDEIFVPFRQGPGIPAHAPGTGVGLSLVARFASIHGGRAWVEDHLDGGASFRVLLPGPPAH